MFTFTFPVPSKGTLEKQHTTNNKNMAKILWHTKKATAGQDSSQFTLDGTKQTSGPSQTLFYQRRVWHYYSIWLIIPQKCPCPTMGADTAHGNKLEHIGL